MNERIAFPKIAKPCPQKWENMQGDLKKRFCASCQLYVHNLNALSDGEIRALRQTPGRCCVGYTPVPAPPRPLHVSRPRRWFRACASGLTLLLALLQAGCAGGNGTGAQPDANIAPSSPPDSPLVMGRIAPPSDLPPRVLGEPVSPAHPAPPPEPAPTLLGDVAGPVLPEKILPPDRQAKDGIPFG